MSCGVGRTPLHNQKVSEVGKANRSKNSLQLNDYRRSPQDSRFSSFNLRNVDKRCAILSFPTLECDGQWRIVALPLQYFDHTNRVNMNGLHLVSSPSINSFKVDGRETRRGPRSEFSYSSKPFRTRSLSGSNVQSQFRHRRSSITCNDSSAVMSKGSNATMFVDRSKDDESSKRNSRKKARKGKHRKKHLCDVESTESEVCGEYTCGSSASEICESSNGVVTSSHSQNISTCDIDEVISESILPSQAHKFHGEHHADMQDSLVFDSVSVGSNSEEGMSSKTCDYTEGTKHGLARSSFDGRKVAQGKRDKQFKSVPGRLGSMGNLQSRSGIESGHSVWKRVQKDAVEKGNIELKKTSSICSQLEDAPLQNRNITALPITDDKRKLKNKIPRNSKRKVGPSSRQESGIYTRKEYLPNKVNLNAHAKTSMPKSGILDNELTSLDDNGVIENHSRPSQLGYARVDTMKSESVNDFKVGPTGMEPYESVCDAVSGLNNQDSLGQNSCFPSDQSDLLETETPVYLSHLMVNGVARTEKGYVAENGKQSHNLGSFMRKWIPVGIKECGFTSSRTANLPLEHSNGPDAEDGTCSKNSSINENGINQNGDNFLIEKTKGDNLSANATDLNKIAKALNDGYRAQMASEAVQMTSGGPIAEFERLLHFCSPVICHSYSSVGCENCLLDKVPRALLCRHATPNIPLGCLWQWYEKHGSYGLEIRAEDYENTNRLGVDQVEFRAYFVPFLSAVQLFSNSTKAHSTPGVSEAYYNDPTSTNSTNASHLPTFSALVPQPHSTKPSCQSQVNDTIKSEVSPKDAKSVDMELVFEYFESEQPRQRLTLYEKIQELVRDDASPHCKLYGDPVHLNSINMHDLHPRSWYSVAWYPIYRIPDGNFRAAFLTYHSLGHFVRRSSKFDYTSVDACIVSPVVGLKSYSAQGECWFQPRHSTTNMTYGNEGVSPSRILKERLRTLEETASLMARAVVDRGNGTSVNRHPDYEFFVSRQRS